jgi:hypothetical protein
MQRKAALRLCDFALNDFNTKKRLTGGGNPPTVAAEEMLPFVRLWLWISAFASLAGWGLSAAGQLNRTGYAVCVGVAAIIFFLPRWKKHSTFNIQHRTSSEGARVGNVGRWMLDVECSTFLKKSFRRFRRLLPFCFAALAVLIFLGGTIHAPGNYTGLAYRTGRVLQWLSHGHWFWIDTEDFRMNDRACGIEWLSAPILLFTNSTRGLFLINFLPFLLLPGLIFSVFTQLGVRARVAWHWMWLLPTGYNFILQAGGIANDTFPTVYALAAVDFGLRAWKSRRPADLWHSILAAALLTGAKASNLPLLLPWAILFFPLVPLLRKKIASTALVVLLAAAVSFLPTAILNVHYLGDWSGLSIERTGMAMKNPVVGVWGNALLLLLDNFTPPLFPFAGWWNAHALVLLPHFISAPMIANFEPGFLWLGELPTEDWAGIGFGLSVLLAISAAANFSRIVGALASRRRVARPGIAESAGGTPALPGCVIPVIFRRLILIAPCLALLAFCMKSGMVTPNRLIAPYYPLLLPLLLVGAGQSQIVRRVCWRALTGGVLILAFVVLILTPDRPLWPAQTILSGLAARHPNQHLISRALDVYAIYAKRSDPLADVRTLLPPDAQAVGFIGAEDDCDISLWLPLGSRRVEHFRLSDAPERFRQEQIKYAVVGGLNLQLRGMTLDAWLQKTGAEVVASTNATQKVSEGPQAWFVVRFK